MTERPTPERSALLLADASRILGIRPPLKAWPAELPAEWLAALLAGAAKGDQFKEWHYRIMRAIEAGHLAARTETTETTKQGRVRDTGERIAFAGMASRVVFQEPAKTVSKTLHHIVRDPAATWLRAAALSLSDTVRGWLGPAWGEEAEKVDAGDTAPPENPKRQKLRAMLQRIKGLDPCNMPGQKIDFHALACAYDKDFQVSPATFSGYLDKPAALPKLCTFAQGGKRDSEYYRAAGIQIGVTAPQYDRALKDLEKQKASAKKKKGMGVSEISPQSTQ